MKKILVVRRDNIGDLICTLPLLDEIRLQVPDTELYAYVNQYNAPILAHYQGLTKYWAYQKAKHRTKHESRIGILWARWKMALEMRQQQFDVIVLAGGINQSTLRWANWLRAKRIIQANDCNLKGKDHEVERTAAFLEPLGLDYEKFIARHRLHQHQPSIGPKSDLQALIEEALPEDFPTQRVAIHISARKVSQRWPIDRFIKLIHWLCATQSKGVLLFWSPGSEQHPQHPGDDEKLQQIMSGCSNLPIFSCHTETLDELIAGLSLADSVICADGGAMHVAAALRKPIIALFGDSEPQRWHPWGTRYTYLQSETYHVHDLRVEQVQAAWAALENSEPV